MSLSVEIPGRPRLYQLAPLPGWDVIGTVTTKHHTGALVRNRITGTYCRANGGALTSLPQGEVRAALKSLTGGEP
jgi:hypothetical protein